MREMGKGQIKSGDLAYCQTTFVVVTQDGYVAGTVQILTNSTVELRSWNGCWGTDDLLAGVINLLEPV